MGTFPLLRYKMHSMTTSSEIHGYLSLSHTHTDTHTHIHTHTHTDTHTLTAFLHHIINSNIE